MEALRFIRDNIGSPFRLEPVVLAVVAAAGEPMSSTAVADEVCLLTSSLAGKATGHVGETLHKLRDWGLVECTPVEGDKRGTLMWSATPRAGVIAQELVDLFARVGALRVRA